MRRLIGLAIVGVIGTAVLTGCGTATESANAPSPSGTESSPGQSSAAPSPTLTPPLPATYALTDSTIDIADLGQRLTATTGTIEITQGDGGGQRLLARGTRKKGAPLWDLDLAVTNQGRVSGGMLQYAGRTWNVTPGTGDVRTDRTAPTGEPSRIRTVSVGAITVTEAVTPTVNTPMVITLVGSSTQVS